MEYNIQPVPQASVYSQVCNDFQRRNSTDISETQILRLKTQAGSSKPIKRVYNFDILSPQIIQSYALRPNILDHSSIQQNHRAKIRLWIAESCHTRGLTARVASLAGYILDLYFSKGSDCSLQELHQHGICCLKIANKLEENVLIPVNYDIFSRQKLIEMEAKVLLNVGFQINPVTFTDITHSLNNLWASFRAELKDKLLNTLSQCSNGLSFEENMKIVQLELSSVLLHETLELLFLILESFSFSLDTIVFNTFYLILCLQFYDYRRTLTSSKILGFTKKSETMSRIRDQFTHFCNESNYLLNLQVKEDCLMFIYPVYNALISQDGLKRASNERQINFNPNDPFLRSIDNQFGQTLRFENKSKSLKRYMKRQTHQNLRKCSEMTRL